MYEEEYLVNSVGRLIERANAVGDEVARLVEGLMRRGMRERAVVVSAAMEEVEGLCKACVPEVWQVGEVRKQGQGQGGDDHGEGDKDGIPEEEQSRKMQAPTVKGFETLSLIAT